MTVEVMVLLVVSGAAIVAMSVLYGDIAKIKRRHKQVKTWYEESLEVLELKVATIEESGLTRIKIMEMKEALFAISLIDGTYGRG